MTELYTQILEDDDDDAGIHRTDFSNAVSCWIWMQQRQISVADAALAFSTTPELIRRAVDDHSWMFLSSRETETDPRKQMIEHDGE